MRREKDESLKRGQKSEGVTGDMVLQGSLMVSMAV